MACGSRGVHGRILLALEKVMGLEIMSIPGI